MQFQTLEIVPERVNLKDSERIFLMKCNEINKGSAIKVLDPLPFSDFQKMILRARVLFKKCFKFKAFKLRDMKDHVLIVRVK